MAEKPTDVKTATRAPAMDLSGPPSTAGAELVRIIEAENAREHEASSRAEFSIVERLSRAEGGAKLMERRKDFLQACYVTAIQRTRPPDWVLFKDREGNQLAMLKSSGAHLVAELYGIEVDEIRPTNEKGDFAPERVEYENGAHGFKGQISGWSRFNGRQFKLMPAEIRSDEEFTGRSVDGKGNMVKKRPEGGAALDADLISSLYTRLHTKLVRCCAGMVRVPVAELVSAWKPTPEKNIAQCEKGSGFGTSSERGAQSVTGEDVKTEAKKLGEEIMRRVNGDQGAAAQLLKELTANPEKNFAGVDSIARLSEDWQVKKAWAKLRVHPTFGDAADKDGKA